MTGGWAAVGMTREREVESQSAFGGQVRLPANPPNGVADEQDGGQAADKSGKRKTKAQSAKVGKAPVRMGWRLRLIRDRHLTRKGRRRRPDSWLRTE